MLSFVGPIYLFLCRGENRTSILTPHSVGPNMKLERENLETSILSACQVFSRMPFQSILIDTAASLRVSARHPKNLLHCNRFFESGRFSFSRIGVESGVKIEVRFSRRYCRADTLARQILASKPALKKPEKNSGLQRGLYDKLTY